jgi:hypothetical protein
VLAILFKEIAVLEKLPLSALVLLFSALALTLALMGACSAGSGRFSNAGGAGGSVTQSGAGGSVTQSGAGGSTSSSDIPFDAGFNDAGCTLRCSPDLHSVVDCNGTVMQCAGTDGCDPSTVTCANACQATVDNQQAVGCEYYATDMDQFIADVCFAAFVANTWDTPAHISVDFAGTSLAPGTFARIPSGAGPSLTYTAYDPVGGLPPGEVAILFLAGSPSSKVPCPAPVAMPTGAQIFNGSDIGNSFHITTDVPVVAYEINPYGGGSATVTGASLLLSTSVWDLNYVAVTATPFDVEGPSMNIIAAEDDTLVTLLPTVAIEGGGRLPAGEANVPYVFTLNKGEQAQFTQDADLTGSVVESNKPIGFMAGQPCMLVPEGVKFCDHGEQMVPPVKALGNEYVGVMFRPRVTGDMAIWHLVGAVGGTELSYSSAVGGPATLDAGQTVDFITDQPFVVKSQDLAHPFMLFTYMSGSEWSMLSNTSGYGDPDFVISVPPQQYLSSYVFFADVTYPETNLVIVRAPNASMGFDDVTLDCAGVLTGWQPVGEYEWTRIDLMRHDFVPQGNCSTGRHEMSSASPFGLWVWGWGSSETTEYTANVSYGYPGGMNVQPINQVVIPPMPQ